MAARKSSPVTTFARPVRAPDAMPDAELELECVGAEVTCRACGAQSEITSPWSIWCPRCDSSDVQVLRGNEFLVTSLDVS